MQTQVVTPSFSLRRNWLARSAAALLAVAAMAAIPNRAHAGVFVSVTIAPPVLPVYVQPPIPGPGYIWTPGYWAWGGDGYYWVPGTWVLAPFVGALWTPGYWGWSGGYYAFHPGYWGWHVGFYGGINYGYGYGGFGYGGGYWRSGGFYYNRTVNNVTNNITNVYNKTVINNTTVINRTSFNGGPNGIAARATPQEMSYAHEQHIAPVAAQQRQMTMASQMPALRASMNHGAPPIAATPRVGAFSGQGISAARGASPVMEAAAVHQAHLAPQPAMPRNDNALRSASFAPHANSPMRPLNETSRSPQPWNGSHGQPNDGYARQGSAPAWRQPAGNNNHGMPYRPQNNMQSYRPQNDQLQGYRPQGYVQQAYRPAPAPRQMYQQPRPAGYAHAEPPHGRSNQAPRHDDKQH